MQKYGICFFRERRPGRERYNACITRPVMTESARCKITGSGVKIQIDSAVDPCENMDEAIKRFWNLLAAGSLMCKYGTLVLGKSGYFYFVGKGTGFKGRKSPEYTGPRNVVQQKRKAGERKVEDEIPDLFAFADAREKKEKEKESIDEFFARQLAEVKDKPRLWGGYELADPKIRAWLWKQGAYRFECMSDERRITTIRCIHPRGMSNGVWLVDGMTAEEFAQNCVWAESGDPCGVPL